MKQVGLLGGTFNPPHRGHLHAAQVALAELPLEELWFLPDAAPPHKQLPAGTPTPSQRAEMTALLARELPKTAVSRFELELPPPSYTARTVTLLQAQYPDTRFTFIVGSDMLLTLARWVHPEIILQTVSVAALSRKDEDTARLEACAAELRRLFGARITLLSAPVLTLSSTALRETLTRRHPADLTPPAGLTEPVFRYICDNGLYLPQKNGGGGV